MVSNLSVSWSDIKAFIDQRKVICQWLSLSGNYHIYASDGGFTINCILNQDGSDPINVTDFETNYKANGNKSPAQAITISATPAFSSKTLGAKSLYKRVTGKKFSVIIGDNTLTYTATFPLVKFTGLEIIGGEVGDVVSLYVLDSTTGTYSTVPNAQLNQFGYTVNVGAGYYLNKSEFDSDIYLGMQIKIVYTSATAKNVGINYIMNEVK